VTTAYRSLWLPTGGHVEPGEHPVDTVCREVAEELGIQARFDAATGRQPFFLTVTETVGSAAARHTDVSVWFALEGRQGQVLHPDPREFTAVRWCSTDELRAAAATRVEPHLLRALPRAEVRRGHCPIEPSMPDHRSCTGPQKPWCAN